MKKYRKNDVIVQIDTNNWVGRSHNNWSKKNNLCVPHGLRVPLSQEKTAENLKPVQNRNRKKLFSWNKKNVENQNVRNTWSIMGTRKTLIYIENW